MDEELRLLKSVAARLVSAGIEYMMTGSMALALYATPRMTRDIDIIVKVASEDIDKIIELFRADFYIDEMSVRAAVQTRGIFNIIHYDSIIKIDFIVRKDDAYRIEEFSRRQAIDLDGASIVVVAPEDLILSKLVWAKQSGSELHYRDVRQMIKFTPGLDRAYLEKWAEKLSVTDLLRKVRADE